MAQRTSFGQRAGLEADRGRPAVVVKDLTERFRLYHERPVGLKERLYRMRRASFTEFNALEQISFTVEHGESVGLIGHNGSGKSTLLRLLARILPPDEGRVVTNGRVATLLELGAGFHGDLTGRENIYLNGAILGLKRSEIEDRFEEIVDFAGIRPLLDTAVRTYSSGLYVRLGFAIAVTVDPDILLVDEVLAVGDAEFQARSLARMRRFHDDGKTMLLVSHDLDAVQEMCERVLVLERGRVVFDGPADEGVGRYRERISRTAAAAVPRAASNRPVAVEQATLLAADARPAVEIAASTPVILRVRLSASQDIDACGVGMRLTEPSGASLYEFNTVRQGLGVGPMSAGDAATVDLQFLAPRGAGEYHIEASVTDADGEQSWAIAPATTALTVVVAPGQTDHLDLGASASVTDGPTARIGDVADLRSSRQDGPGPRRRQA